MSIRSGSQQTRNIVSTIGATLFALWGVLHSWVGIEGLRLYHAKPVEGQWAMYLNGRAAPLSMASMPTDVVTRHVHANILLNFCLDIGGYGLLGLVVAWMIYKHGSRFAYALGVVLVGVCDVSFTFLQLTPGIIALNLASVSGPILWLLAAIVTPFGLRRQSQRQSSGQYGTSADVAEIPQS